jgi:hypothetical protein
MIPENPTEANLPAAIDRVDPELMPQQVLKLADGTERRWFVVDVGGMTPKEQMARVVKWRQYLRRFLAP